MFIFHHYNVWIHGLLFLALERSKERGGEKGQDDKRAKWREGKQKKKGIGTKQASGDSSRDSILPHASMEIHVASEANNQPKRRRLGDECFFDELNQDLLEGVLSWLPPTSFFRLRSVCKRWSAVATSPSFKLACSGVPSRDPWFLMVDHHLDQTFVFDTTENNWKMLNHPPLLQQAENANSIPVASAGGLVCFRTAFGEFIISNPITGACRKLPKACLSSYSEAIHAIAMHTKSMATSSYKIVIIYGQMPHLRTVIYDSLKNMWEDEFPVARKASEQHDSSYDDDDKLYFLSKAGDVISTNMQRSPSKQFSSVILDERGEQVVYFLSGSGTIVKCNLAQRSFSEYPRLFPVFFEYSVDLVECSGEMFVVVLSEFLETASLRVWKFSERGRIWLQVAAMPPSMSHELHGKKADINCVGHGNLMLICVNADQVSRCIVCNLVANQWIDLPSCSFNGEVKEFLSAFSFEPRLEACV